MQLNYSKICNEIEKNGYRIINKFWDNKIESEIEDFYQKKILSLKQITKIDKHGNKCFAVADNEIKDNPFNTIKNSKTFVDLYKSILKYNNINPTEEIDVHNVISFAENQKKTNTSLSTELHFDAFCITIIIPIKRSSDSQSNSTGKLTLYPNIRNFSSSSIKNYIVKFLIQNRITRWIFNTSYMKKKLNFKVLKTSEKDILVFYGYRSLHGNEALSNNNLKVNAIFHIFNPHKNSKIDKYIFNRNKKIRNKKLLD